MNFLGIIFFWKIIKKTVLLENVEVPIDINKKQIFKVNLKIISFQ